VADVFLGDHWHRRHARTHLVVADQGCHLGLELQFTIAKLLRLVAFR
jgi:hypothetical protein